MLRRMYNSRHAMALVNCRSMIGEAHRRNYAVAQLNTNGGDYNLTRAILEAAESCRSPVILGVYEANAAYAGLPYIAKSLSILVEEYAPTVPVALHLDHGSGLESCARALRAGFSSVMYDGSKLPLTANIATSTKVSSFARAVDATFEAELGSLLDGKSDPENPNLALVSDVRELTAAVSVDMLAVAIGNSHGFYKGEPRLNTKRLEEIAGATDLPLVLHGTTGLSEGQIHECIALGMAKVNLGTVLRSNCVAHYVDLAGVVEPPGHPWRIGREVKDRLRKECEAFLELLGSSGKA